LRLYSAAYKKCNTNKLKLFHLSKIIIKINEDDVR
jgi:hypothetical protein